MLFAKKENDDIEEKIIDNIKALNIDIINTKHNGNFDISLGLSKALYTLYSKHLRIDPTNPNWLNRDRVVLSSSSAYSLLTSILFMSGYNISLDSLKEEEISDNILPGIDIISNNFSEGLASATGISIGEKYLHEYFKINNLYNFYTYVICTDLDIIKGTSFEALTLAGALRLNKLIIIFDNNKNVLDENESNIFNVDIVKYFESLNLNTIIVDKNNLEDIDNAFIKAKSSDKPTVIILNHDSNHERFENNYIDNDYVLTAKETSDVKEELGVRDIPFTVSSEARDAMIESITSRMQDEIKSWNELYKTVNDDIKSTLEKIKNNDFSISSNIDLEISEDDTLNQICYKILNSIGDNNQFFIGGTSNYDNDIINYLDSFKVFTKDNYLGRCINYSLREGAIASIQNGISLVGLKNFSITNLKNVSKLIPSIRIATEFNLPNIYILIEDNDNVIDGLNHYQINETVSLRSIPNLEVYRPNDANELIGTFKILTDKKEGPACVIINNKKIEIKEESSINDIKNGAYIIKKERKNLSAIIISSGKELDLALDVANSLTEKGYNIRVISMPSIELYEKTNDDYKNELIPVGSKVFVIDNSAAYSWDKFVDNDNNLITPDKVKWYSNDKEIIDFKNYIIDKIENLLN